MTVSSTRSVAEQAPTIAHEICMRLLAHLDAGTTDHCAGTMAIDRSDYVDPERWEREREIVFGRHPQVAALSAELRRAGDFKVADMGGVSVILSRREDGAISAFLNECRHRGAEIAHGRGHARRFVCPYHAWSYNGSGELVAIPSEASFCDLDKASRGLLHVPVHEEHGLIWVVPDPDASIADGAHLVHGLEADLEHLDLDRWHFQYDAPMHGRLNWKIVLETYLETYHLPFLHRKTAAGIFYDNVIAYDGFGPHLRYAWPRRTIDELRGVPMEEWDDPIKHINLLYYLFPNTIILHNAGVWQVRPGAGPGESNTTFNFFTIGGDGTMSEAQKKRFEFARFVTETEDVPAGESMQRNFSATAGRRIMLGTNEVCLQHVHSSIAEALERG